MNWRKLPIFPVLIGFLFSSSLSVEQRRMVTVERIRELGAAIESYRGRCGVLPDASTIEQLVLQLSPSDMEKCPGEDGWGNPLHYSVLNPTGIKGEEDYWIGSSGGREPFAGFLKYILKVGDAGSEIVFSNGCFVNSPADPA